ncbi:MAG TPA: AraC family transcriptional regulator [Armatimonadota bacterium]|nr:AraC family transcriptional regulator [Armatimonadota bacterium]HOS42497.1 AraC family transcriptional regulator [Armatimonadota bacterium]
MINIYCYNSGMETAHPLFTNAMLARLRHPEGWRIISTHGPPDVAPVAHPAHRRWMAAHSHRHANLEVLFFLDGAGWHGHRGNVYPCAPGTVLLFDAFEEHDRNCPPSAPDADHLWVALTREHAIARRVAVRAGRLTFAERSLLLARDDPRVSGAFLLRNLAETPPLTRRLRIISALATLLAGVIEAGGREDDPEDPRLFRQRMIATVQQHIRDTAGRGATLDHLARLAGYSKYHFLRLFSAQTGTTVHQYIDDCRRARARQRLGEGASKKAIARELGFSCPAAYSRWARNAFTGEAS